MQVRGRPVVRGTALLLESYRRARNAAESGGKRYTRREFAADCEVSESLMSLLLSGARTSISDETAVKLTKAPARVPAAAWGRDG